ncbi:hypothetical protein CSW20_06655 [Thermus scotoductus]|nr:hypothetical protein CSW20_06655 [Thermus scotoductus]
MYEADKENLRLAKGLKGFFKFVQESIEAGRRKRHAPQYKAERLVNRKGASQGYHLGLAVSRYHPILSNGDGRERIGATLLFAYLKRTTRIGLNEGAALGNEDLETQFLTVLVQAGHSTRT